MYRLALFLALASSVHAQEKKENPLPLEKWNFKELEEEWNVKVKSLTYDTSSGFRITVNFTADGITKTLDSEKAQYARTVIYFYFIDEDGVIVGKRPTSNFQGELTGKTGDAFRFLVSAGDLLKDTVKVEARKEMVAASPEPKVKPKVKRN